MNAHDYLENHRRFMKAALGTTLVLFGGSFSTSMMFVHALGPTLPALNESASQLKDTFLATRTAFDNELPSLLKSKESALKLEKDIKSRKYKDAENEVKLLRAGGDAVSHVVSAIDPVNTKKVFGSLYRTALVGIAAVQNEHIAMINMGANTGDALFNRFNEVGSTLQSKFCKHVVRSNKLSWKQASLNTLTQALSISVAYKFKQAAPIAYAAILGSQMCTDALDDLIAPMISKIPDAAKANGKALIQCGLIYYGCTSQMSPNAVAPAPLAPLLGFEDALTKAILRP